MYKLVFSLLAGICCLICVSCKENHDIIAPDKILVDPEQDNLWITNRYLPEIILFDANSGKIKDKKTLPSPASDLIRHGRSLWLTCEGTNGFLLELDATSLKEKSRASLGYQPSALSWSDATKTFWITLRFTHEVCEFDPVTRKIITHIPTGREPIDILSFDLGEHLLVAHNLPATSSTDYPAAASVSIIDCRKKQTVKQIILPNGTTDVRSIASDPSGKYAYITHILARYQLPTNQVDRGWMCTNALSIIDLESQDYVTTVLLDAPEYGAANPGRVQVSPDGATLAVALEGIHHLALIDRNALHARIEALAGKKSFLPASDSLADIPNDTSFLQGIRQFIPTKGKGPRDVAFTSAGVFAVNYFTGELFHQKTNSEDAVLFPLGATYASTVEAIGEMYFHDATLCYQNWQSCASCHPNGARMDGLNWDLLNDGAGNPKNTKSLLLSHKTPPCMVTGIRKDAETAVRSGIRHILFAEVPENIPLAMDAYLKSLKPLPSPFLQEGKLSAAAVRGRAIFDNNCASCHSGPYYTDGKQYTVDWATGHDREVPMDVPTLIETWRTAPYLYDGRSADMQAMLKIHGPDEPLSPQEYDDLAEYVLSL